MADPAIFGRPNRRPGERPVLWQEHLRHELEAALASDPVVLVPTGSVEQHGPHGPLDVDTVTAHAIAVAAAERCGDVPAIVAPPVWTGLSHYKLGHAGTISISMATYTALLGDICRSLHANGVRRIVLVNGHGGNRDINRALALDLFQDDIWIVPVTWWDLVRDLLESGPLTDEGLIGHAGGWETSLMLHLRPELVDLSRAEAGDPRASLPEDLRAATYLPERRRERANGIHGDATKATPQAGELLFTAAGEAMARLIREVKALDRPGYREFGSWCP
jgi:creatinine amidohydrolase